MSYLPVNYQRQALLAQEVLHSLAEQGLDPRLMPLARLMVVSQISNMEVAQRHSAELAALRRAAAAQERRDREMLACLSNLGAAVDRLTAAVSALPQVVGREVEARSIDVANRTSNAEVGFNVGILSGKYSRQRVGMRRR